MRADVPVSISDLLYLLVGVAVAVVFGVFVAHHADAPHVAPVRAEVAHAGCFEQVQDQFYICPDGRSYYVDERGRWHDAGRVTSMPLVPAR